MSNLLIILIKTCFKAILIFLTWKRATWIEKMKYHLYELVNLFEFLSRRDSENLVNSSLKHLLPSLILQDLIVFSNISIILQAHTSKKG